MVILHGFQILNDVLDSLNRALIRQKWMLGDRWNRIGHPFIWVDGKQQQSSTLFMEGPGAVLQALSIYYEEYPTLDDVRTDDHDQVFQNLTDRLGEYLRRMGMGGFVEEYGNYIHVTALTRAQDYSFIKRYAAELPAEPAHLDIGPGFGSHAFYSLFHLGGGYTGFEASDFYIMFSATPTAISAPRSPATTIPSSRKRSARRPRPSRVTSPRRRAPERSRTCRPGTSRPCPISHAT